MIRDIVEEHASEAGLLWSLRDLAAREAHYDLDDLATLDDRIEAHLDGLRIAGEGAWEVVKAALLAELEDEHAGEVFAATAVATDHGDLEGIAALLDLAGASPALARGMVSAMGWLPLEVISAILPGLLDPACPAELTWLGLGACAAHRHDPEGALDDALQGDDARLRARALHTAGVLGRSDLVSTVSSLLDYPDEDGRFCAAFALALLGRKPAAGGALRTLAVQGGKHADVACMLAVRCLDPGAARELVEALGRLPISARRAMLGAGALGDPALVPLILQSMEAPALARVAGEAFTMITGADLTAHPLAGSPPEGFDAGPSDDPADPEVRMDPDRNLPWPDRAAVERSWGANRARFPAQIRHLLGKPLTPAWLGEVLRRGRQRQRAAAAIEQALGAPGRPLFNVRAPAFRQRRALTGAAR